MKCNFIHMKLKDKRKINLNINKVLELFKLSAGNNIINLNYNTNKKDFLNNNLGIIYFKKYIKKNIGNMIYKNNENLKEIQIFTEEFISNNIKIAKIILNNKLYELKKNIENKKQIIKIKIKFLDIAIFLNSMFRDCKSLFSVQNFQNINTKYLKTIYDLFARCSSLTYIDDISNWNINNINDISAIFCECSSLKCLPNILMCYYISFF